MATTLDLDEQLGEPIEIKKGGSVVYTLRSDVSSRVLLAAFTIRSVAQRLASAPANPSDEEAVKLADAAVDGYYSDVHKVCLRIIQHTYPQETSAELNAKLSEEHQERILRFFSTRRSPASNPQQNDTDETSNGTESTTTGNRATRRAAARSSHK